MSIVRTFSVAEAAWLAGVIDGEGTIGLYQKTRRDNNHSVRLGRTVVVQMSNTHRGFVERMRDIIGCGGTIRRRLFHTSHKGRKPMFKYSLEGSARCAEVLRQIEPYLIIKRERAQAILREIAVRPFGRWKGDCRAAKRATGKRTRAMWRDPEIRARIVKGIKKSWRTRQRSAA